MPKFSQSEHSFCQVFATLAVKLQSIEKVIRITCDERKQNVNHYDELNAMRRQLPLSNNMNVHDKKMLCDFN